MGSLGGARRFANPDSPPATAADSPNDRLDALYQTTCYAHFDIPQSVMAELG
jgi:hypothetical protein